MNRYPFLIILLFFGIFASLTIQAENSTQNPLEWFNELEIEVLGQLSPGGLLDRLNNLEEIMTGRIREGNLVERLSRLDTVLFTNQPHDLSMLYKIQSLEWIITKEGSSGCLKERLEKVEQLLFGAVYAGPISKRLERLVYQVFSEGTIKGQWVNIPEGQLVEVRMIDNLSSSSSKPGDKFKFMVVKTVTNNNHVLFPKGIIGSGILQEVKRPGNLGRDARLMLDLAEIRALDGTPIKMYYGFKALQMDRSLKWAVGASAAGMLAFGPGGILAGLAIRGKEKTIPAGTEFYLQVKEPVRVYTLPE